MRCERCKLKMLYFEGEDEGSGDQLMPYAYWFCATCDITIHDYEERFEYPPDKEEEPSQ